MPISIDKGLIFVRIPNETDSALNALLPDLEDRTHHGVSYYLDKYEGAFSKTKKFCIIRNPWDRFALYFEFIKETTDAVDHDKLVGKTFAEFVEDFEKNRESYVNSCWLPQTAWIWSDYGPIVNHVFVEDPEYLEAPQFVSLNDQIKNLLGLDLDVPAINREAALNRREKYYTPELVERVSKLYAHEIQAFSFVYDQLTDEEQPMSVSVEPMEEA